VEWDIVFINSECKLRLSCFSLFQIYYFLPKLKAYIIVDLISVCRKNYSKFLLFCDNTINTISPYFSSLIVLNLTSLAPNPIFYICNEILFTSRLKISFNSWTPITYRLSSNVVWNIGRKSSFMKTRKLCQSL